MCFTSGDDLSVSAALPESSHTGVNGADKAVGFTVLGEVEPRSLKRVRVICHLLSLKSRCSDLSLWLTKL